MPFRARYLNLAPSKTGLRRPQFDLVKQEPSDQPIARTPVQELFRLSKLQWNPTAQDWWRAGLLVRKIGDGQTWNIRKPQEFENDALIALNAERQGAALVTSYQKEFELLLSELKVSLVLV